MKKILLPLVLACGVANAQLFSENFNSGALPSGWTVNNPDSTYNWGVGAQNGFSSFPNGAAFFDDDDAGPSGINTNARLVSPIINLTAASSPKLSFKYANMIYQDDTTLKVEAFNGTSWVQVFTFSGEAGVWDIDFNTFSYVVTSYADAINIDLTPYANANFQLRFVYDDVGDYSYGVVVDDIVISATTILGTSEISASDKIKIYPNPVKDDLFIKSDDLKNAKVSVMDMSGKKVKTFEGKSEKYNLSDLPSGTYMILIDNGKEIVTKKILKK